MTQFRASMSVTLRAAPNSVKYKTLTENRKHPGAQLAHVEQIVAHSAARERALELALVDAASCASASAVDDDLHVATNARDRRAPLLRRGTTIRAAQSRTAKTL